MNKKQGSLVEIEQKNCECLNDKDIENIKEDIVDKDIIDDDEIDYLKSLRKECNNNKIVLAKLFLKCYNLFRENLDFISEDFNLRKKIEKLINSYEDIWYLIDLIEDYGNGEEFGSYYCGERIKDYVMTNRINIHNLINLFFKIYGGENV